MSYAVYYRETDKRVGEQSQFAPVERELEEGQYHSYLGYVRGTYFGPDMRLRIGDAEGTAKRDRSQSGTDGSSYLVVVEGITPGDVKQVVDSLHKKLGMVDLTPPPVLLTLGLPKISGFFRRVKFIFWDYLVRGRIPEGDNVSALEADNGTEGSESVVETDDGAKES